MDVHFIYPNALIEKWNMPQNLRNSSTSQACGSHYSNAQQFSFFPHAIALWNTSLTTEAGYMSTAKL